MRDNSQRARAQKRIVDLATQPLRSLVNSLIEFVQVSSVSAGAGSLGALTTSEDESVTICEPYGFTSRPPGSATAIVLAPGGETQDRIAIGVMSPTGKPEAAAGDAIAWTAGGHVIHLDDDGGITITARSLADVTIVVDDGQVVNVGDALAAALLKAQAAQDHIVQAATYAYQPGNFAPQDGGVLAFTNFAAFLAGTAIIPPAIPGNDLVNAAATTKAKGT